MARKKVRLLSTDEPPPELTAEEKVFLLRLGFEPVDHEEIRRRRKRAAHHKADGHCIAEDLSDPTKTSDRCAPLLLKI